MGPGDDAAVFFDGRVLTTDALIEGVHFDGRLNAEDIGFKAIAVSASDVGAMGARPDWAMLALSLPAAVAAGDWTNGLARGVGAALRRFGVALVGGDTTASPGPIMVTVSMGGRCVGAPLTRAGCRPGDVLWVTGYPGLAAAGYVLPTPPEAALLALRRPCPPIAFACDLARFRLASAAMDVSDGIAADLPRLAARSGVGFRVDPSRLPLHPCLPDDQATALALSGGDAYELLFTAPQDAGDAVVARARRHGVRATAIGFATAAAGIVVDTRRMPTAFAHFPSAS